MALPPISPTPDNETACREIDEWLGPCRLYPVSFSIPEELVLNEMPPKEQSSGEGISRGNRKYRFGPGEQQAYYEDYQRSYFGLTYKKGGWDCMRHLEIMANGTLPFFPGIEDCPRFTMAHYPKQLIQEIYNLYAPYITLEGLNLSFDPKAAGSAMEQYDDLVRCMLDHVRTNMTTKAMARYVLEQSGHANARRVLYVSGVKKPDYQCDTLFHGMRSLLGEGCVDVGKIWWMYDSASEEEVGKLYGQGFTYSRHLPDIDINRSSIKKRIAAHEFDLVIFGSINRCHDLLPHVREHYDREEVVLIDGEDYCRPVGWSRKHNPPQRKWSTARKLPRGEIIKQGICFKRELDHAVLMALRNS